MGARGPSGDWPLGRLRTVEFLVSVAVLSGLLVLVSAVLSLLLGTGLGGIKNLLFILGFLVFGVGAIELRPPAPWRSGKRFSIEPDEEPRLGRAIQRLPPMRDHELPFEERIGRGPKLFAASLVVLVASFVLEVGLGVGA